MLDTCEATLMKLDVCPIAISQSRLQQATTRGVNVDESEGIEVNVFEDNVY
jgi:hypothetical protein